MTPEERKLLQDTAKKLTEFFDVYYRTSFADKEVFNKTVSFNNNVVTDSANGIKFGATGGKTSVNGVTPVVKASAIGAPTTPSALYSQAEAASAVSAINSIRTALINFGISS